MDVFSPYYHLLLCLFQDELIPKLNMQIILFRLEKEW